MVHSTIPLVFPISAYRKERIINEISMAKMGGFDTIKIKIGSKEHSTEEDIAKIKLIAENMPSAKLRIDANQALNLKEAMYILKSINDLNIEVFEQPFPPKHWDKMKSLYDLDLGIPLMLDESINGQKDLEKAESCADFVKFKLMKQKSFENLFLMINKAQELGLKIIVGNGVQSEIGCYYEGLVLSTLQELFAGENNGFLKQIGRILNNPIKIGDGNMIIKEFDIKLNERKLKNFSSVIG
jgi:L-alanine-DL-glutamate epimerase-like enolase superfamily enzyme